MRKHSEEEMEDREHIFLSPCYAVTPSDNRLRHNGESTSTPRLALGPDLGEIKKGACPGWKPRYSHQSQQKTRFLCLVALGILRNAGQCPILSTNLVGA